MNVSLFNNMANHYNNYRRAATSLSKALLERLPATGNILDIGAGTGNYTQVLANDGFQLFAVEPALEMQAKAKPNKNIQWITATAESLPLNLPNMDAIISIMSIQHLSTWSICFDHWQRLCPDGPWIIFTWDPRLSQPLWVKRYFPTAWSKALEKFPSVDDLVQVLQPYGKTVSTEIFLIPDDYEDQFIPTVWKHPELYLNNDFLACTSGFSGIDSALIEAQQKQLKTALESGVWEAEFGHLQSLSCYDIGCILLVLT